MKLDQPHPACRHILQFVARLHSPKASSCTPTYSFPRRQPDLRPRPGGGRQAGQVDRRSLRLVHVVDDLIYATGIDNVGAMTADLIALVRGDGERLLKTGQARVEASGVPVETALFDSFTGRVCDLVVAEAMKWPADLIVLGTHGRRGVGRLFMGSDAEQIVRLATVPVLLVRASEVAAAQA